MLVTPPAVPMDTVVGILPHAPVILNALREPLIVVVTLQRYAHQVYSHTLKVGDVSTLYACNLFC